VTGVSGAVQGVDETIPCTACPHDVDAHDERGRCLNGDGGIHDILGWTPPPGMEPCDCGWNR